MRILLLLQVVWLSGSGVFAQNTTRPVTPPTAPTITNNQAVVRLPADSAKTRKDSIQGDITTTIKYSARDSIVFDVAKKVVNMYGDANINYGDLTIKAAKTIINYNTNLVSAYGTQDSTGKAIGTPVFRQGAETYTATQMDYNFKSKKGKINGVVTRQGEGFLHAEIVKRNPDESIFGAHARYTTCDLPHPHFYINAPKIKAIPGKKIFTGPFNLVFADIPTPLGFLFGYFPTPSKKRSTGSSGVIIPTFGETRQRGFYLRQGGYYLALNEYIGMQLLGDIYSFGSWGASFNTNYSKRYSYQGNFRVDYTAFKSQNTPTNSLIDANSTFARQEPKSFWISWNHSPGAKPGGKFSASVRAGSTFYNQQNQFNNPAAALSGSFSSSVQYQFANPNSPVTFTVSALHDQNVSTKVMNLTLPQVNFAVNRQYLFRPILGSSPRNPILQNLADIAIAYNMTASNRLTNNITGGSTLSGVNLIGSPAGNRVLPINPNNFAMILKNGQFGAQHNLPITMNSIRLFRYFSLSPGVSYSATTYLKQLNYTYINEANAIRIDTLNKFSVASVYSANASLTTRIYGMANFNGERLKAIRHQLTPFASYSYSPDLVNKYSQPVQLSDIVNSTTGYVPTQFLSRYNNFLFGTPSAGRQSVVSFGIQNQVEAKMKPKGDTASTFEKVSLIDNFSISGGYNFAADSFQLQPLNAQFRTTLFKRVNIFSSANLDPYQVNSQGRRLDRLMINESSLRFARLTSANVNVDFELNPEAIRGKRQAPTTNRPSLETDVRLQDQYVDFSIPWTLRLNFQGSYFAATTLGARPNVAKTVGIDGSLNLTEKWKIRYSSNYDFQNKTIAYTSVNIDRDLHCWTMSIMWVPFGRFQSYSININARASILRDLKLSKRNTPFQR